MKRGLFEKKLTINALTLVIMLVASFLFAQKADAASLGGTFMRLDRMGASNTVSGTACAKITTTASIEGRVTVNFPSTFTLGTAANFAVTTAPMAGWPTIGTTAPWIGIGSTAMAVNGTAVTIASGDLTSTAPWYCFNFTSTGSSTGTAGIDKQGSIITQTSAPADIDTGNYATAIITNDQIAISAVVPPNFSFALSGNTSPFPNLSTTTSSAPGITASVITNAANGWTAWVKSLNAGLNSASTGASIGTAGSIDGAPTDLAGTTGFVLDVDSGTGSPTIAGEYNGGNATSGGTLSASYQQIASGAVPTATDSITLYPRAKIVATQQAANDYTDTLTVIAAGLY